MSEGVQFEEDSVNYRGNVPGSIGVASSHESKMSQWLIRHGFASSPKVAQGILIGIIVLNIVITYFVIRFFL